MGLIKAALGSVGGVLADQWKEYFYCESLPANVLALPRTNNPQELAEIYSSADLFLNPSREETFGMTTLEAIACGTKAVVYRDTACQEIAEVYGGIAVPQGESHLYEAVCRHFEEAEEIHG